MPNKPQFSDYEPVTRPRSSKETREEEDAWRPVSASVAEGEDWPDTSAVVFPQTDFAVASKAPAVATLAVAETTRPNKKALKPLSKENWILRRGHAVSYAGLFLFTFVLYYRPYEWDRSLLWMSSAAFWIAAFTLLVFIPTQLGLEGNVTTRPREVNLVLLLLVTGLLSLLFALDRAAGWGALVEYVKVVAMFIVMVNVVRTELRLKALMWLVLVASVIVSIGAVNDYRLGNLALQGRRIEGVIGGLFSNPNDLALHLVIMVPIVFGLLLATRNPISKLIYLVSALIFTAGIVVTFSRGGFLGFVVVIFVLAWKLARRSRIAFAIVGVLVIGGAIALAPGAFRGRLATTDDASASARADDLKRSIYLSIRHPLFGVGIGNYVYYSNVMKATHNAYTQVAAEMGLAAGAFYLLFLITPIRRLRRIEHENRDVKGRKPKLYYLAVTIQASLIGFMVTSFFSSVAYLWYPYYLVGYAICVRRIYSQMQEREQQKPLALNGSSAKPA